jgi:hypothetical protein
MGQDIMTSGRTSAPPIANAVGQLACSVGGLDNTVFCHLEYGCDLTPGCPVRPGRTDLFVTCLDEFKSASVEPLDGFSRHCQVLHRVSHVTSLHNRVDTCKRVV